MLQPKLTIQKYTQIFINIIEMFGKVKAFLIDKAFGLAYMRYDRDGTGTINPNQLTSLVNDVFQLLKIQRQASFIQVGLIMKVLDLDGDSQLSKEQSYNAVKGALAKFGGIGGILQYFGKTGSPQTIKASTTQQKNLQKINYNPPEDIDQKMLATLPPVGQNVKKQEQKNVPNQGTQGQQNQGWGQQNQGWGGQNNQAWGQQGQGQQNQGWGQQGTQNQGWGQQGQGQQNQGWGQQGQGWQQGQQNQGWSQGQQNFQQPHNQQGQGNQGNDGFIM